MNKTLPGVISDIFTHHGAVVEEGEDGRLEYLSPSAFSELLDIPEYGSLSFTCDVPRKEAIHASYDSELFRRVGQVFRENGRFSSAICPSYAPDEGKLEKTVSEGIVLSNATFRMDSIEIKSIAYLLVFLRYVAKSDERHEGLFPLLINELNLSTTSRGEDISNIMENLKESGCMPKQPGQETIKALTSAYSAASPVVEEKLGEFVKSLERRLNRDIRRVSEYYETLKDETGKAIKRKILSKESIPEGILEETRGLEDGEIEDFVKHSRQWVERMEKHRLERNELIEKKTEDRTIKEVKKLLDKLQAIEAEQKWKIQDVISKYAMNVEIKHVSAIRIETQAPLIWINIMRRRRARQFPLTYNPMLRGVDPLPCESCFYPRGSYYICDDNLHVVCSGCFKKCAECGRQYCTACYRDGCPKCKSVKKK